jgi:acetyl esterase/lipase
MTKFLTAAAAAVLLLTACTARDTKDPWITPPIAADSLMNLSYDSDTSTKLDLYLPQGRSNDSTPLLIVLHGGSWVAGDKSDMRAWISQLKTVLPKYAIANVNYRLCKTPPVNAFPSQETDVQIAVNYLYSHRSSYNISDRIVILGYSSGGQLALLQSYKRASPVAIKAVVSFSGPSDMVDLYNYQPLLLQWGMQYLMGGSPTSNAMLYQESSPQTFVGFHTIPSFLVQGGLDSVVPYTQTDALQARLQASNVLHSYLFYPGEKHIYSDTTRSQAIDSMGNWLHRYID